MVARISIYEHVDLALADEVQRWIASLEADPFAALPGYGGSMTLVDRDNARMIGIGFYAGPDEASEAEAQLAGLHARAREVAPAAVLPALDLRPQTVGLYDVVHRA